MILRRVIEHFRKQEWTAIFLDFVIVVAGVFVGLQVSNWNAARAETAQERDILASIAQDLRNDRMVLQAGEASLLASIGAGEYVLDEIGEARIETTMRPSRARLLQGEQKAPETDAPDADERNGLWAITLAAYSPAASHTAYDALTNTGKLSIIKDHDLIRNLQDYRQLWIGLDEMQSGTSRPLRNDAAGIGHRYGLSLLTPVPEEELLRKMRENEELRAALRTQVAVKILHYASVSELDRAAEALLSKLEREGAK
ncbi:MAG TPA: hypothetical protein DEA50_03505 [Parvularcula sp.]|nr:hypothetical protein [Parvularcula sp.]